MERGVTGEAAAQTEEVRFSGGIWFRIGFSRRATAAKTNPSQVGNPTEINPKPTHTGKQTRRPVSAQKLGGSIMGFPCPL